MYKRLNPQDGDNFGYHEDEFIQNTQGLHLKPCIRFESFPTQMCLLEGRLKSSHPLKSCERRKVGMRTRNQVLPELMIVGIENYLGVSLDDLDVEPQGTKH